jgi:DNA invertase Pin-like site-specific DNA recombinase
MNTSYRGSGGIGEEYLPAGSGEGGIFVYVRRSAEDRSGRPLSAQIATIREYIKEYSSSRFSRIDSVRSYFGDNGVSGSLPAEKRDGLSALLKEVEEVTKANPSLKIHVIVYDATRMARSVGVGTALKEKFERWGVTLHLAQPRMVVEGANAELFFGLNLQMAASERVATITRVKNSFKYRPDWDPRKSYGWKFDGSGTVPEIMEEEQNHLKHMKTLYEQEGKTVSEISKTLQLETGSRRSRRKGASDTETLAWTGTDVSFLASKHKWKWGGGKTFGDLEEAVDQARTLGETMEEFLERNSGLLVDGVKINRPMLKKVFVESQPEWRQRALARMQVWVKHEKFSVDELVDLLNENAPRPGGVKWARQTAWRVIKEAEHIVDRDRLREVKR